MIDRANMMGLIIVACPGFAPTFAMAVVVGLAGASSAAEELPETWLRRAEGFAGRINEPADYLAIWRNIAYVYAAQGDIKRVCAATQNVEQARRGGCLQSLADQLACAGRLCLALQILDLIEDPVERDEATCCVTGIAAEQHKFADAEAIAARIKKSFWKSRAWCRIAVCLAHAGDYQAAEKNLLKCDGLDLDELREAIDEIRAAKRTGERSKPRPYEAGTIVEFVRGEPWVSNAELACLKNKLIAKSEGSESLTLAWYRVALAQKVSGDTRACRESLASAIQEVRLVPDAPTRVMLSLQITDLLLELGAKQQAEQFFSTSVSPALIATAMEAVEGNRRKYDWVRTLGPIAVGVLIRLDRLQQAFEIMERDKSRDRCFTCLAVGAFVGLAGDTAATEQYLSRTDSDRDKAAICVGVATGLLESSSNTRARGHQRHSTKNPVARNRRVGRIPTGSRYRQPGKGCRILTHER
jgi:tetratricopeptide (TPR) repeat protein